MLGRILTADIVIEMAESDEDERMSTVNNPEYQEVVLSVLSIRWGTPDSELT